jgi:hypothetical protein
MATLGRPASAAVASAGDIQRPARCERAWSHAQFVRLAWSIDAGRPIERPAVVACRYAGCG